MVSSRARPTHHIVFVSAEGLIFGCLELEAALAQTLASLARNAVDAQGRTEVGADDGPDQIVGGHGEGVGGALRTGRLWEALWGVVLWAAVVVATCKYGNFFSRRSTLSRNSGGALVGGKGPSGRAVGELPVLVLHPTRGRENMPSSSSRHESRPLAPPSLPSIQSACVAPLPVPSASPCR